MAEAVGFIGVGAMGSAIASRLIDDYELHVNDRNPAVAERLLERGATFAGVEEIAAKCNYIFLSLPRPTDVLDLLFGEGKLADLMQPGSVVIDTTTGSPTTDGQIIEELTARRSASATRRSVVASAVRRPGLLPSWWGPATKCSSGSSTCSSRSPATSSTSVPPARGTPPSW